MRVMLTEDQQEWLWGCEPPATPQRTDEYWQRGACLAVGNLLPGAEVRDDDQERGDVFLSDIKRWVRVRCETNGSPLSLFEDQLQPSIYVLVYYDMMMEDSLDVVTWTTREKFKTGSRLKAGREWVMDREEMDPIQTLLIRLRDNLATTAPEAGRSSPAATRLREAVSKTARSEVRSGPILNNAVRVAMEEAARKPKRDWAQYGRLTPRGPCPTGCGDILDGAASTCWTCMSGLCETCGTRTHAPLLVRCSPCNMKVGGMT